MTTILKYELRNKQDKQTLSLRAERVRLKKDQATKWLKKTTRPYKLKKLHIKDKPKVTLPKLKFLDS
jgi:hypothetical protein